MTSFSSLPDDAGEGDILKLNPAAGRALIAYHSAVMRQPSALTPAQRELIAAFVSVINASQYCFGVHSAAAAAYGIDPGLLKQLMKDIDKAPVDDKLKPILHLVSKLTREPWRITENDTFAVRAAGWDERALHDAINVTCLFNFMNRLVEGHGLKGNKNTYLERGLALREQGYESLLKDLGDAERT